MKDSLHNYDIFPKVVPADKETEICIRPLGAHAEFIKGKEYLLTVCPFEFGTPRDYPEISIFKEYMVIPDSDGCIRIKHTFISEQRHYIKIYTPENRRINEVAVSVYSVFDDLIGRYPFVGDLHMHTFRSDGAQAPAIVAANYRKNGYDFLAITDHQRYYPSLEAMKAFADVKTDYCLVPGEEIHLPHSDDDRINDVHIVNFGGKFSVNAIVEGTDHCAEVGDSKALRSLDGMCPDIISVDELWRQVDALAETLDIPVGVPKRTYACCVWIFNNIMKADGLGIFCHPYWISNVYQVPEALIDCLLDRQPFDAFEVLGGERYFEQNGFQTVKYYEHRAKGNVFPIVGSTDSHNSVNSESALICSTIVFAQENKRESIISSIKERYSVAVDTISKEFRMVGDLRLVKYATFIHEEFLPLHDELCYEEGRLLKAHACGDKTAKAALEFIYGRMKAQREKYFAF